MSERDVFMLCAIFNTWLQLFVTASFNFILMFMVQGRHNSNLVSKGNVVFFSITLFVNLSLFLFLTHCLSFFVN